MTLPAHVLSGCAECVDVNRHMMHHHARACLMTATYMTSGVIMQAASWVDMHMQAAERKAITMNMTLNEELESTDAEHRPVSCNFVVDEVSRSFSGPLHQ